MKSSVTQNRIIFDKLYNEYWKSKCYSEKPFEVFLYEKHSIKIQLGYCGYDNFLFDSEEDYFLFLMRWL